MIEILWNKEGWTGFAVAGHEDEKEIRQQVTALILGWA